MDESLTPEQRFQEIAAILANVLLRLQLKQHAEKSAQSSEVSLAVAESSRLTVRVS